jgi:prevent-host-death family protein
MNEPRTVSIRELRQNPTDAINEAMDGHIVTITRNNRPVADIVPHTKRSGATPEEIARIVRMTPGVGDWMSDLRAQREELADDPWDSE